MTTLGSSLATSAIYDLLKLALSGKEPDFDELVTEAIRHASADLRTKYEVEVDETSVKDCLLGISKKSASSADETPNGFLSQLTAEIKKRKVLYHHNPETREAYCNQFSKAFGFKLHALILGSSNYKSALLAKHILQMDKAVHKIAEDTQDLKTEQSEIKSGISEVKQAIDGLNSQRQRYPSVLDGIGSLIDELDDDLDSKISEGMKTLEELRTTNDYREGIKLATELLQIIPHSKLNIIHKTVHIFLGLHLKGQREDWEKGISELGNLDKKFVTPFCTVIQVALLNNLQKWPEGLELLNKLSQADILSFSKEQKDTYHQAKALLFRNLKRDSEAREEIKSISDKNSNEYRYIQLTVYANDETTNLLSEAEEFFTKTPDDPRFVSGSINYILDRFNILTKKYSNPFQAQEELADYLEKAFLAALRIADKIREVGDYEESIFSAIAAVGHLLGKHKEVAPYIKKGVKLGANSFIFKFNGALCFFLLRDMESAVEVMEGVSHKDLLKQMGMDFYLEALRVTDRINQIQEIYKSIDTLDLSTIEKDHLDASVGSFIRNEEEVEEIARRNFEKYPDKDWAIFDLADALHSCKKYEEAEQVLTKNIEKLDAPFVGRAKLAKIYQLHFKDLEKAVEQYSIIISPAAPTSEQIDYLQCLMGLDRYESVVREVDKYDPDAVKQDLQTLKGYALWQLGEVESAFSILKPIAHTKPSDLNLMYNYAQLCWSYNNLVEMEWALREVLSRKPEDWQTHITHSKILSSLGKTVESVKAAKRAYEANPDDETTNFHFISTFITASNQMPENEYIQTEELKELHRDLFQNFNARFPNSKLLTPFSIKYDENGKIDLSDLKKMLEPQSRQKEVVFDFYWKKGFPISFVMSGMKRNSHEIWSQLITSGPNKGINCGHFNDFKAEDQIRVITGNKKGLVIDVFALYALASAEKLDILKNIPNIHIGTKTLEELTNAIQSLSTSKKGHMAVGVENGELVKEELTAERVQQARGFLENILSFCNENFTTIAESKEKKRDLDKSIDGILEPVYDELAKLCVHSGYALIAGDWNFAQVVSALGAEVVNAQAIALHLARSNFMAIEDYSLCLTEWLLYNYQGVTYIPENIAFFFEKEDSILRKNALLERVLKGNDFRSVEHRVKFLIEIFLLGMAEFAKEESLSTLLSEYLNNLDPDYRILFGIGIFSQNYQKKEIAELVHSVFDSLNLVDIDGNQLTSSKAKLHLEEAYKAKMQSEFEQLRETLGLSEIDSEDKK